MRAGPLPREGVDATLLSDTLRYINLAEVAIGPVMWTDAPVFAVLTPSRGKWLMLPTAEAARCLVPRRAGQPGNQERFLEFTELASKKQRQHICLI